MIRQNVLAAFLSMVAFGAGAAEILPQAYQVRGVAKDDVLNIRAAPSASAESVGQIGPYGMNVEVIETSPDGVRCLALGRNRFGTSASIRAGPSIIRPIRGLCP